MRCAGCLHSDYCYFFGCALWLAFAVADVPETAPAGGYAAPPRRAGAACACNPGDQDNRLPKVLGAAA